MPSSPRRSTPPPGSPLHILESQVRACNEALAEILRLVLVEGRPADRSLAGYLRARRELGSRDRRLISNSIFSVFRWWGWLRHLAPPAWQSQVGRGITAGRPAVDAPACGAIPEANLAAILLVAAFLEQDELPPVAPLWAELAGGRLADLERKASHPTSIEEVGGVLINSLRFDGGEDSATIEDLVPSWSLPLLGASGGHRNVIEWLQRRPPIWLRVQKGTSAELTRVLAAEDIKIVPHPTIGQAARMEPTRVNLYTVDSYRKGYFEIQDLASQCIGLVCAPAPGSRWWDACAGAGGKSLELAALMQGKGTVVATDIRAYKLDDLRKRSRRAGFPNIQCKAWDGRAVRRKQATFDGVLVDAPCSCSGTWRRNPDARWSTQPEDVAELAALQGTILAAAASGVKPGGILVYATCSWFEQENAEVVRGFLREYGDFELDPFPSPLAGRQTDGMLQVWPWDGDCDAMFVARLHRQA